MPPPFRNRRICKAPRWRPRGNGRGLQPRKNLLGKKHREISAASAAATSGVPSFRPHPPHGSSVEFTSDVAAPAGADISRPSFPAEGLSLTHPHSQKTFPRVRGFSRSHTTRDPILTPPTAAAAATSITRRTRRKNHTPGTRTPELRSGPEHHLEIRRSRGAGGPNLMQYDRGRGVGQFQCLAQRGPGGQGAREVRRHRVARPDHIDRSADG